MGYVQVNENMWAEMKVVDLLKALSDFNLLTGQVAKIIGDTLDVDAEKLCETNGITCYKERNED